MEKIHKNLVMIEDNKTLLLNHGKTKIALADILYMKSDSNYTDITYVNEDNVIRNITSSYTLKIFKEKLAHLGFVDVTRGVICNEKYIQKTRDEITKKVLFAVLHGQNELQRFEIARRKQKNLQNKAS